MLHTMLVHVAEVVDRGPLNVDIPCKYVDDENSMTRTHYLSFSGGLVDGIGPSQAMDGGHCFGGHNGHGTAGGE